MNLHVIWMLANAKGTLTGGWEFVSYNADGSLNEVPALISDVGMPLHVKQCYTVLILEQSSLVYAQEGPGR